MLCHELLKGIEMEAGNVAVRERTLLDRSVMDHLRNGRGFWPVITVNGMPQVVRFSTRQMVMRPEGVSGLETRGASGLVEMERWTPETGQIDLVPLHALPVADWPRVRMGR